MANRTSFHSLLTEAGFAPAPQINAGKKPNLPEIPKADPEEMQALDNNIKQNPKYPNARELGGPEEEALKSEGKDLRNMIDQAYVDFIQMPEIKNIPPKPQLYLFDSRFIETTNSFLPFHPAPANVLISTEATKGCSKEELEFLMSHEAAHKMIFANPEMLQAYMPPNFNSVRADLERQGIAPDSQIYPEYLAEMLADELAIRRTHNPAAAASALTKAENDVTAFYKETIENAIPEYEKKIGRKLSPEEREQALNSALPNMKRASEIISANSGNPYPPDEVRIEAMRMAQQRFQEQERNKQNPEKPSAPNIPLPQRTPQQETNPNPPH